MDPNASFFKFYLRVLSDVTQKDILSFNLAELKKIAPFIPFHLNHVLYCFIETLKKKKKDGGREKTLSGSCQITHVFSCVCVCPCLCVSLCIVVNCSDPGIPANSIRQSKIEHGNFTFGTVVFYDCNPGYYLFGSPVLTCQPTGQWDKPLPECIGEWSIFLRTFPPNEIFGSTQAQRLLYWRGLGSCVSQSNCKMYTWNWKTTFICAT